MKIIHYTLGFPPIRTGGLVKYALDLMIEQKRQGHEIIALFPGLRSYLSRNTFIKKNEKHVVSSYEIVNSLPLPLFGGIKTPEDFMLPVSTNIYKEFLLSINPDIIHVHTLMGVHLEFFQAAKDLNIRVVYTSHDYFGLAPEPNFHIDCKNYDRENTIDNWIRASSKAMDTKKLKLFQSRFYPQIRLVAKFVKKEKNESTSNGIVIDKKQVKFSGSDNDSYNQLKEYYSNIFLLIDKFHFNSNLAKEVFLENIRSPINYKVITITNSNIRKIRIKKREVNEKKRIAYIGPNKEFKGYYDFISLSKKMNNDKYEFHTYGYVPNHSVDSVVQHGKYQFSELSEIYKKIDILIFPSKWKETFGLTVLEAISHGVPVFVSKNVGSKDLLDEEYMFSGIEELIEKIEMYNFNSIIDQRQIKLMSEHTMEIINFYSGVKLI